MAAQSFQPVAFQPVVLLTRPAAQSARFAESLRARLAEVRIVTSPLISPVFMEPVLPDGRFVGVILTSETGAEAAGRMKAKLPDMAFCVGDRTALVAEQAGFATLNAKGDAKALLDLILSHPKSPLLYLRGREVSTDLSGPLAQRGVAVQDVVVYAQQEQPLTAEAEALLLGTRPILAPVFSPRSAQILTAECRRIGANAPVFVIAMSDAVAEAAVGIAAARPRVALHPDGKSMLEAVVAGLIAGQGA